MNRPLKYYLDKDGNPQPADTDVLAWARWYEKAWPARKVAQTIIPLDRTHRLFVSTVFLSLDHNFGFEDKDTRPILYETMVFYEEFHRSLGRGQRRRILARRHRVNLRRHGDTYQRRYHTREEAQAAHNRLITYLTSMHAASVGGVPDEKTVTVWCDVYVFNHE